MNVLIVSILTSVLSLVVASESSMATPKSAHYLAETGELPKFWPHSEEFQLDSNVSRYNGITVEAVHGSVSISVELLVEISPSNKKWVSFRDLNLPENGVQFLGFFNRNHSTEDDDYKIGISKIVVTGVSSEAPGTKGQIILYGGDQSNGSADGFDSFRPFRISGVPRY